MIKQPDHNAIKNKQLEYIIYSEYYFAVCIHIMILLLASAIMQQLIGMTSCVSLTSLVPLW